MRELGALAVDKTVANQADKLIARLTAEASQIARQPLWIICAQIAGIATPAVLLARWW